MCGYETLTLLVTRNVAFQKKDFNMAKLGFRMSGVLGWGIINDPTTASVTQYVLD